MIEIISITFLALFGIIFAINVISGLVRGLSKSLANLFAVVLSIIIALIATLLVCSPKGIVGWIEAAMAVTSEEEFGEILSIGGIGEAIAHYASMFVAPFLFTGIFCLVSVIVSIITALAVKSINFFKDISAVKNRLFGALVGLLCGFIVPVIIFMPIVGTIEVVASAGSVIESDGTQETDELIYVIESIDDDKNLDIMLGVGCRPLYNAFASTRFEGEKVYLRDEVSSIVAIVNNVGVLAGDFSTYGEDEIASLNAIVDSADSSPLLKNTAAGILSAAAESWVEGESFIGIEKPSVDKTLDPIVNTMLTVMATSDKDNICTDLRTMTDVLAVLIRNGVFSNSGDSGSLLTKLGEGNVISDITIAINKNDRMSPLADEIVRLGVNLIASTAGVPETSDDPSIVTIDEICSELGSFSDTADSEKEAEKVADIISTAIKSFDTIDFGNGTPADILTKLGEILDLMNESEIFGQRFTSKLLVALMQSDNVTGSLGISVAESTDFANKINDMVENGHFDYTHATEVIADTITMIEAVNNREVTREEKKENVQKLLDNLTAESAEMIGTMVTSSLVENYGVSSEKSDIVSGAVSSLLDNMASYETTEENSEESAKEAEAVSTLLDLAITGSSTQGSLFTTEEGNGSLDTSADEFVELVVTSSVVSTTIDKMVHEDGHNDNPLGIPELSESDKTEITGAIESYYVNNGGGADLAKTLESIAAMMNVDVELDKSGN